MTHIPGNIKFIVEGENILELQSDGLIRVRGKEIVQDKEAYEAFKDWLNKTNRNTMWTSSEPYNLPTVDVIPRDKEGYHSIYVRMWFGSGKSMHKKGFRLSFKEEELTTIPEGTIATEYFLAETEKTKGMRDDRSK